MFKGSKKLTALILVVFVAVFFGFSVNAMAEEENVVRVGAIYPLSGESAANGEAQRRAHDFAVEKINEQGGIESLGGAKIEMIYADSESRPELGTSEAERLITEEDVHVIMGTFESHVGVAIQDVTERYNVPLIIANALADEFVERDAEHTYKTVINTTDLGRDTAAFVRDMSDELDADISEVAILYGDFFFGHEVARGWQETLPEYGFDIVADIAYPVPATDLSDAILSVRRNDPDIVFTLGNITEATLLLETMRSYNYWPNYAVVGVGGGFTEDTFFQNVGDMAEGLFVTNDWFPNIDMPGAQEINQEYRERYGVDMIGNANTTYASMWVLVDALERAASLEHEDISRALAETDIGNEGPTAFMYEGVAFDETGMNIYARNAVAQVQDGELNVVWPLEQQFSDPVFPVPHWNER